MDEKELQRITDLTRLYVNGFLTADEQAELDRWLDLHPMNRELFEKRINVENTWKALTGVEDGERRRERVRAKIQAIIEEVPSIKPSKQRRWRWYAASAAVLLLITTGLWLVTKHSQIVPLAKTKNSPAILPGGNRAILQLADGSRIDLAAATKGTLVQQGNVRVIKMDSGQLSYLHINGASSSTSYNTIFTPAGGTYKVILPDNTTVWLNAKSSLRYPTNFTGGQRQVEMNGEAYFEVAKNKAMPFIVKAGDMNIRVLGTHFNVQDYSDEKSRQTTLLEGSIALKAVDGFVVLRPGEQASVINKMKVTKVDTDEVVAWKDGYFSFNHADIETVMRQISRWYNVDVNYQGEKTNRKLSGKVSRQTNASDVLEILEANGYHFSISEDGKTITILP
jgi:ferric-dicitrate binding protein FerR (iron transport regulator)